MQIWDLPGEAVQHMVGLGLRRIGSATSLRPSLEICGTRSLALIGVLQHNAS